MSEQNFAVIIGNNIKYCLDEYEMDIKAWAKVIGVTRQTAASYIEGLSIIDSYKLHLTAKRFHKRLEWFLEETHDSNSYVFTPEQHEYLEKNFLLKKKKGRN